MRRTCDGHGEPGILQCRSTPAREQRRTVDFDQFEQNIKDHLEGHTVGYAYAIYQGLTLERSGAGGHAVLLPPIPQASTRRMSTLDMGKTITAVAVLKAMEVLAEEDQPIDVDCPIDPFLPSRWHRGPGTSALTFRMLLTHRSKLMPADVDPHSLAGLERTLAAGAVGPEQYQPCNFALFRVILPYLYISPEIMRANEFSADILAAVTAFQYIVFLQDKILKPCGISGVSVTPTGPQPYTRHYKFGDITHSEVDPAGSSAMLRTGACYWNMSAEEYCRFIAHLQLGKIISRATWQTMRDGLLGCYRFQGARGTYLWHHGYHACPHGAGCQTGWMAYLDNRVSAVILVNSIGGLTKTPQAILRDAFDSA
jgi:CubicO group peptidase (beta-lactamase class C family)